MIEEDDQSGFGERQQVGLANSVDARVAFYRFALGAYGYRCAISGQRFEPQPGALQDRLEVVPIHPRELDGPLEVGNVLVLETSIASAFAQGLFSVDDNYQVIVWHEEALPPQLREHVVSGRELYLPEDPLFRPAKKHLNFHRFTVARTRG